jgi:hypothetical protein
VTNALVYYDTELITSVKSFITQTLDCFQYKMIAKGRMYFLKIKTETEKKFSGVFKRHHDNYHYDIQRNDNQHNGLNCDTHHMTLGSMTFSLGNGSYYA